jgi:fumarylacetoacetase
MMNYDPSDPRHRSWVDVAEDSDFPIQNLPFGVIETDTTGPRVAVPIGEKVVDLARLEELGYLKDLDGLQPATLRASHLNPLIALGKPVTRALRKRLSQLLHADNAELRDCSRDRAAVLLARHEVRPLLPVAIGDYVDFYSSLEHATNVGRLFRPDNPLLPNWKHLPIGYHGRTSTIVAGETPIRRPRGQTRAADGGITFGPSGKLDFELEVGFIVGRDSEMGSAIPVSGADEFIFGLVLVNDWSARDIQAWEYQPLGPFLGKSFATSISPWVVTLDALEPFRVEGPRQEPPVLAYLRASGAQNYDLHLEVQVQPEGALRATTVCRTNFRYMYWSMCQQLAHLTSNGTSLRLGDLCASGTVSGPEEGGFGSLLELTRNGEWPLALEAGHTRTFLEDGDMVTMRGHGARNQLRIGFGGLSGRVLPSV